MKQDKLEQFIIENRKEFDMLEPPEKLWDRIKKPGPLQRKSLWTKRMLRIAAAIAIFLAAWFSNDLLTSDKQNTVSNPPSMSPEQMEQYTLLMEAELFYSARIKQVKAELKTLANGDREIIQDVNTDLLELDEIFNELKNDLKDNVDNEEVIEAMIQNYRLKLGILEEMLKQMNRNESNHKNNSNHEI